MSDITTIDAINQIIKCDDLLTCADLLITYSSLAYQEKQRKAYIKAFNIHLTDMAFALAPRASWFAEPDCDSYKFFTGSDSVKLYLRVEVDMGLTPVHYLKSLKELADAIKRDFDEPTGNFVHRDFVEKTIKHLNKDYSFVEKYYGSQVPTFIFLDHCHMEWNSVCVPTVNYLGETLFYIFLFHLKKQATYTPEYVFLHELGHVVQTKLGSSDRPPESFYEFLHGDKNSLEMGLEEQKELFSDGFASTILYEMGLQSLDPFNC